MSQCSTVAPLLRDRDCMRLLIFGLPVRIPFSVARVSPAIVADRARPYQKSIGDTAVTGSDFFGLSATKARNRPPAANDLGIKKIAFKGSPKNFLPIRLRANSC